MFPDAFTPLGQVPATAARLDRAAAELRERAGSPLATPRLPVTLTHLEHALDQLATTMRLLAEAATEWHDMDDAAERPLPPDARALLWHLRSVADTMTDARDGCRTALPWARKLLGPDYIRTRPQMVMTSHGIGASPAPGSGHDPTRSPRSRAVAHPSRL